MNTMTCSSISIDDLEAQSCCLQHVFCQSLFGCHIAHNGVCDHRWNAQVFNIAGEMGIFSIYDHNVEEVAGAASNANCRNIYTQSAHELICRAFDGCAANDRADGNDHATCFVKSVMNAGY